MAKTAMRSPQTCPGTPAPPAPQPADVGPDVARAFKWRCAGAATIRASEVWESQCGTATLWAIRILPQGQWWLLRASVPVADGAGGTIGLEISRLVQDLSGPEDAVRAAEELLGLLLKAAAAVEETAGNKPR